MDRRAHYLLRAAAIAVLVVEAAFPRTGPVRAQAPVDAAPVQAPADTASAPVAMAAVTPG